MMQKILDKLEKTERDKIQCIAYGENMDMIIRQFEEAEIVIGTRFHANILGFISNCKVMPLVYDPKMNHVLDDMEYPMRIDLSEMDTIDVELYLKRLFAMPPVNVEKWKEKSKEQFRYIDQVLR